MDEDRNDNIDEVVNDDIGRSLDRKSQPGFIGRLLKKIGNSKPGKKVKKVFSKAKSALKKFLTPLLIPAIIIFVFIGLISFILNMPGLIRGKIGELFANCIDGLYSALYGDDTELNPNVLNKEKRIELLNYMNDMGIDVVGFGFVTGVTTTVDDNGNTRISDYIIDDIYEINAIDNKVDALFYYLLASERTYIKYDTGSAILRWIIRGNLTSDNSLSGMLNIEDKAFDGISSTVDRENKILNISVDNPNIGEFLNDDKFSFSLTDWTGRYGMPIEFSMALHLATMSSGMTEELLSNPNLQTMVTIGLDKVDCKINFKFRIVNEDGSTKELDIPFNSNDGDIDTLKNKIENNKKINKEDISIEGLYKAYTDLALYDYDINRIDPSNISTDPNSSGTGYRTTNNDKVIFDHISRHLETLGALLDDNDFAVQTSVPISGKELNYDNELGFPIFFYKNLSLSLNRAYTVNSGAFICTYDENGNINENSGKLKGAEMYSSFVDGAEVYATFDLSNETDTYYEYTLNERFSSNGEIINDTDSNDIKEIIPKNSEATQAGKQDGSNSITSQKLSGLEKYKNAYVKNNTLQTADMIQLKKQGYTRMLQEIDWFISYAIWLNDWDLNEFSYNASKDGIYDFYSLNGSKNSNNILYYTNKYIEIINNSNPDEAANALFGQGGLYDQLQKDYELIKEKSKTTKDVKETLDNILKNSGFENLNIETVAYIYEKFSQTADVNNGTVKYAQPYIKSVVKHWFKDIDFSDAYYDSDTEIEFKYSGDSNMMEGIEVVTILKPLNDGIVQQKSDTQPYVIKGDLVLCDGEVTDKKVDDLSKVKDVSEVKDYQWGDGYRTTKKILTQGSYYTYDGTGETSTSVLLQQKIEEANNQLLYFVVRGGRIRLCHEAKSGDSSVRVEGGKITKEDVVDGNGNIKDSFKNTYGKLVYEDENVAIYNTFVVERDNIEDNSNNTEESDGDAGTQKIGNSYYYVIYVKNNALKYLSPVDVAYEKSKTRVEYINKIWDLVDVQIKRKPISFDNTTSGGEVMSLTALSILKNSKTEDAAYIYRDLKEMLIELGYYTQAEFDSLDTDVLTWFIPDYTPSNWPQNAGDDDMDCGAILYPATEVENTEEESDSDNKQAEEEEQEQDVREALGIGKHITEGFEEGLDVIAPGTCRILSKTEDGSIELEFDGIEDPKIGVLDGYTMIISGINTDNNIIIKNDDEEIEVSYDQAIKNKTLIKEGAIIGTTGTEKIRVLFMNRKGGILCNVEDYMAPELKTKASYGEIVDFAVEFINAFEGISDADPFDGDYYTVSIKNNNPGNDIDTIGAGITGWTYPTWEKLGYGQYLMDNPDAGNGNEPPKTFVRTPIPKEVVDNVKKEVVRGIIEETLEPELERLGLNWDTNKKAAWASLYYNGWHPDVLKIPELIASGKTNEAKELWKDCASAEGHYKRRASEWILFSEGTWENSEVYMQKCRLKVYGR